MHGFGGQGTPELQHLLERVMEGWAATLFPPGALRFAVLLMNKDLMSLQHD